MPKGTTYDNDLQLFTFNNTSVAAVGTTLYCALHTGDPAGAGNQTSLECTYGNYDRVGVARTSGGWTVAGAVTNNTAEILFPTCNSGSDTITHFSIGVNPGKTVSSKILYSGALSSPLAVSLNIAPRFIPSAVTVTEA